MTINHEQDQAIALPTKEFFVSMLTRDISLIDAILDLIDNCLDGALRSAGGDAVDYIKHTVKIEMNADRFFIQDDCGGIPRNVAKNYAFKMGREPDDIRDSESETIGMYGVGMKRAIFKMGRDSIVRSFYDGDKFYVPISSAWLESKEWESLPIINSPLEDGPIFPGSPHWASEGPVDPNSGEGTLLQIFGALTWLPSGAAAMRWGGNRGAQAVLALFAYLAAISVFSMLAGTVPTMPVGRAIWYWMSGPIGIAIGVIASLKRHTKAASP